MVFHTSHTLLIAEYEFQLLEHQLLLLQFGINQQAHQSLNQYLIGQAFMMFGLGGQQRRTPTNRAQPGPPGYFGRQHHQIAFQ